MRRVTIGIGAAVALAALMGALVPWTLSGHAIRDQIASQFLSTTGLTMDPPTRVAFALLPRPLIKIENLKAHDNHGGFSVRARVVKGDLRLLALMTGRIELSSITLFHPAMSVDIDRHPLVTKGAIARASGAPAASAQAAKADAARLAVVRMVGGDIAIRSKSRKFRSTLRNVTAKLDWRRLDAPASLSGTGTWRGRTASLTAWFGRPSDLLRGSASPLTLRVDCALGFVRLDGSLRAGASWRFAGQTKAATASLSDVAEWLDENAILPRAFGRASLSARAKADAKAFSFSDVRLSLGGSNFEGSAALRTTAARPALSATLATDALAVTPYLAELPNAFGEDGSWSRRPLSRDLGGLDLDLRISATQARIGQVEMSDLGMAILLENGRLQIDLPEAKAYGGTLKARAAIAPAGDVQTLSASASFAGVDAGGLLWATNGYDKLSGTGSGQFSVHSSGEAVADLVRGLVGQAQFKVTKGAFVGIDFERALRRINNRPLSVAAEVHGGSTDFDILSGSLAIADDKASLQNVVLAGAGARVGLSGDALLGERALRIGVEARQAGPDGQASAKGSHLTMKIRGFWDDPKLVLNVDKLVRRSRAAAPLFETNVGYPQ